MNAKDLAERLVRLPATVGRADPGDRVVFRRQDGTDRELLLT